MNAEPALQVFIPTFAEIPNNLETEQFVKFKRPFKITHIDIDVEDTLRDRNGKQIPTSESFPGAGASTPLIVHRLTGPSFSTRWFLPGCPRWS